MVRMRVTARERKREKERERERKREEDREMKRKAGQDRKGTYRHQLPDVLREGHVGHIQTLLEAGIGYLYRSIILLRCIQYLYS